MSARCCSCQIRCSDLPNPIVTVFLLRAADLCAARLLFKKMLEGVWVGPMVIFELFLPCLHGVAPSLKRACDWYPACSSSFRTWYLCLSIGCVSLNWDIHDIPPTSRFPIFLHNPQLFAYNASSWVRWQRGWWLSWVIHGSLLVWDLVRKH